MSLRSINFLWHGKLGDFVTSLAWSSDGKLLAAASVSGEVAIFHADGKLLHLQEKAHDEGCDALSWHPDGSKLATVGRDGKLKIWNVADGELWAEGSAGAMWAEHVAWSLKPIGDKGHRIAVGAQNKLSFWNEKGEREGEIIKLPRSVSDLAWILNGTSLAVATSADIFVRDWAVPEEPPRAFASRDPILNMAFSPSGKWLMTGNQDCSIHVWNTDSMTEMHMRGFATKVRQMSWHRHNRWFATGGGPSIAVWDCSGRGPEGRTPTLLEWHPEPVSALHYQPDGDWLASGCKDGSIAVWAPTQRQNQISRAKISSAVTRVAWSPDGKILVAAGEGGEVQALEVE